MKGGDIVKRIFLLLFTALVFTNSFFITDNFVLADSVTEKIKTKNSIQSISPTGVWFTEDDELP